MAKFNTLTEGTRTENLARGISYKQSDKMKLVSLLLTSFINDQFYRSGDESINELVKLIDTIDDKEFIAKSAIYSRNKFGMRSITHVLAGEIAKYASGEKWGKRFYNNIVSRVDDMTEIISYYIKINGDNNVKFPNSMKRGFSKAFDKFDEYQLSKYKSSNKNVKLIDIVNIVHPIPNDKNREALKKLVNGDLKNVDTWEYRLSESGKNNLSSEDMDKKKAKVWKGLLEEKRMPYFALLRNLRNIISQSPDSLKLACETLKNEKMIKGSKVLPFRFSTAYKEINKGNSEEHREVMMSINEAIDISCNNVPKFNGKTLVALDTSLSMKGRPSEIGSLFAAILAKSNNCDVLTFDKEARFTNYNPMDSILTIKDNFTFNGGGTNFHNIFKIIDKSYDRIIILSDMQGWMGRYSPFKSFNIYKEEYNCDPFIYSMDLAGYSTLQFPENNVFCIPGFSDEVFKLMNILEKDKNAIIKEIDSINI